MARNAIVLAVLAFTATAGATAKPPAESRALVRYMTGATAAIGSYRILLRRLEALLTEEPHVNVDPLVEKLYSLADRFEDLDARWQGIDAPRGLQVRHRGMGRVFTLFADGYRIHAAALFTRHPDEILASRPKVAARLRSAAYLQWRWAAALRGALTRANLRVPGWLHGMATSPP
jgi:hypothetical protein